MSACRHLLNSSPSLEQLIKILRIGTTTTTTIIIIILDICKRIDFLFYLLGFGLLHIIIDIIICLICTILNIKTLTEVKSCVLLLLWLLKLSANILFMCRRLSAKWILLFCHVAVVIILLFIVLIEHEFKMICLLLLHILLMLILLLILLLL